MDVSAFEAAAGDDVTFDELYARLPEGIQILIQSIGFVCSKLADVGLLVLTSFGCAAAFSLLLGWISLYWLLTQLLLKTATLMSIIYEERGATNKDDAANGSPRSLGERGPDGGLVNGLADMGIEQDVKPHTEATTTAADLDMFEAFLNSPTASRNQSSNVTPANQDNPPMAVKEVHGPDTISERDETLAKLTRQEEEMEAEIQAAMHNSSQDKESRQPHKEHVTNIVQSETFAPAQDVQAESIQGEPSSALTKDVSTKANPSSDFVPSALLPLSKQEISKQKKAAEQSAWLQKIGAGTVNAPKAGQSLNYNDPSNTLHPAASSQGTPLRATDGAPFLMGTADQLAEAADFARLSTRGGQKARPLARATGTNNRLQKRSTNDHVVNVRPAPWTAGYPTPASRPQSAGTKIKAGSSNVEIPLLNARTVARATAAQPPVRKAPNVSKSSPYTPPPHERAKRVAMVAKNAERLLEAKEAKAAKEAQEAEEVNGAKEAKLQKTGLEEGDGNDSKSKGTNPTAIDATVRWPVGVQREIGESEVSKEESGFDAPAMGESMPAGRTGQDQSSPSHLQPSNDNVANEESPHDFLKWPNSPQHATTKAPSQQVSYNELLQMSTEECAKKLTGVAERRSEAVEVDHEPVPPLDKPAERSMSIEQLKSFRPATTLKAGHRDRSVVSDDLNSRIDEANRVIADRSTTSASKVSKSSDNAQATLKFRDVSVSGTHTTSEHIVTGGVETKATMDETSNNGKHGLEGLQGTLSASDGPHDEIYQATQQDFTGDRSVHERKFASSESTLVDHEAGETPSVPGHSSEKQESNSYPGNSSNRKAIFKQIEGVLDKKVREMQASANTTAQSTINKPIEKTFQCQSLLKSMHAQPDFGHPTLAAKPHAVQTPPVSAPTGPATSLAANAPPFFAPSAAGFAAQSPAVQATSKVASANRSLSFGIDAPSHFATSSMVPQSSVASVQSTPSHHSSQYGVPNYYTGSITGPAAAYEPFAKQLEALDTVANGVSAPAYGTFADPSYDVAYKNPYDDMLPTYLDQYQQQLSGVSQYPVDLGMPPTLAQHHYPNVTNQGSVPVQPIGFASRRTSSSKAVPIVKPQGVQFDKAIPPLLSGKKASALSNVQAPPGLTPAHGARQDTFDALHAKPSDGFIAPTLANFNPQVSPFSTQLNLDVGTGRLNLPSADELHATISDSKLRPLALNTDFNFNAKETRITSAEAEQNAREDSAIDEPAEDKTSNTENDSESKSGLKKKRRQARHAINVAWSEREDIRRRQAGTWTLDRARALQEATKTYNDKRVELAKSMASGELSEDDVRVFPILSGHDLSAPRARPPGLKSPAQDEFPEPEKAANSSENTKPLLSVPQKKSAAEINELTTKAIAARNEYVEAHAFFKRPAPKGKGSLRDLKAQAEARVELKARHYARARADLDEACGGSMSPELKEKLWTYDDKAEKRNRDAFFSSTVQRGSHREGCTCCELRG